MQYLPDDLLDALSRTTICCDERDLFETTVVGDVRVDRVVIGEWVVDSDASAMSFVLILAYGLRRIVPGTRNIRPGPLHFETGTRSGLVRVVAC